MACVCHPVPSCACAVGSLLTHLQLLLRVLVYISSPKDAQKVLHHHSLLLSAASSPLWWPPNFIRSTSLSLSTRCLALLPSRRQPCVRTLSAQAAVSLPGWEPWSCTPWLWSCFFLISLVIAFYCISPISLVFPVQSTGVSVCSIYICIMNGWLIFINSIHMKWIVWVLLLLGDNSWLMVQGSFGFNVCSQQPKAVMDHIFLPGSQLFYLCHMRCFTFVTFKADWFFSIKIIFKKILDTSCLMNSITFFFQDRHISYTLKWLVKKPSIHSQWPGSSSHHLLGMTGDDLLASAITDLSCNIL